MSEHEQEERDETPDVEGHKVSNRVSNMSDDDTPDVEGHRVSNRVSNLDDDEPDVEGHVKRTARAFKNK